MAGSVPLSFQASGSLPSAWLLLSPMSQNATTTARHAPRPTHTPPWPTHAQPRPTYAPSRVARGADELASFSLRVSWLAACAAGTDACVVVVACCLATAFSSSAKEIVDKRLHLELDVVGAVLAGRDARGLSRLRQPLEEVVARAWVVP